MAFREDISLVPELGTLPRLVSRPCYSDQYSPSLLFHNALFTPPPISSSLPFPFPHSSNFPKAKLKRTGLDTLACNKIFAFRVIGGGQSNGWVAQ